VLCAEEDDPPVLVKTYKVGEGFRRARLDVQLATSRVNPRQGRHPSLVMDRPTFRRVLMDTTSEKRTLYEGSSAASRFLGSLDRNEIAKVADCLVEQTFATGEYVIRQDEPGDNFYIVSKARRAPPKRCLAPPNQRVMRYRPGDYFGELALLNDKPRAANVIADGPLKVVTLDRQLRPPAGPVRRDP